MAERVAGVGAWDAEHDRARVPDVGYDNLGLARVPLPLDLAAMLRDHRPRGAADDAFVFPGRDGAPSDQGSLRRRVLVPAAGRAGMTSVGFHTLRHTCASMLIESGLSPLRLQRRMGHHSAAFTLETYGHLIDGEPRTGSGPAQGARISPAPRRLSVTGCTRS